MAKDVTHIITRSRTPTGPRPYHPSRRHTAPHTPLNIPMAYQPTEPVKGKLREGGEDARGKGNPAPKRSRRGEGEVRGPDAKRDREPTTLRRSTLLFWRVSHEACKCIGNQRLKRRGGESPPNANCDFPMQPPAIAALLPFIGYVRKTCRRNGIGDSAARPHIADGDRRFT